GTASKPYSAITIAAVSKSTAWLMVAITPLDINFLMSSIGLFSIFWARSRITMLAGNSILFPLLLIGYLLKSQTSNEHINILFIVGKPGEKFIRSHGYLPAPAVSASIGRV